MDRETYIKAIVPIGACYAGTLWVGNAAYLYLSVSFIQMLKALMPVAVFSVSASWELRATVAVAIAALRRQIWAAEALSTSPHGCPVPPTPQVGCVFGTERFGWPTFSNMVLVTIGVAIASYGIQEQRGG